MRSSFSIDKVQSPIIPTVAAWVRGTPGTLSMGQGMVAYPPPSEIMQACCDFGRAVGDHLYGASLGEPRLLAAITAKLLAENAIDCAQGAQVMVTAGANMAFLNVLLAILDPGDEVILPVPYYFNQEMAIRMLNGVPVTVPTTADYQLCLEDIKAAITPKTRAILTVSPNNPTGAVYSEADLRAVNALCRTHGIYHISDEAYEYFLYDGAQHFSPGSIPGAAAHTISLYSLSKAYGFASWRIGYAVVPEALIPALLKVQDTNLIAPPLITQAAALAALDVGSSYCKVQLQKLEQQRAQVLNSLHSSKLLFPMAQTQGAFYQFVRLKTERNDLELVRLLIQEYKVAAIPGCAFGMHDDVYLRISYGMLARECMQLAMARLLKGLEQLC